MISFSVKVRILFGKHHNFITRKFFGGLKIDKHIFSIIFYRMERNDIDVKEINHMFDISESIAFIIYCNNNLQKLKMSWYYFQIILFLYTFWNIILMKTNLIICGLTFFFMINLLNLVFGCKVEILESTVDTFSNTLEIYKL